MGLGVEARALRLLGNHAPTSYTSSFACSSPRLCVWDDSISQMRGMSSGCSVILRMKRGVSSCMYSVPNCAQS